ncbi:cell envelope integrity protein TolA [Serratia nevei]|uniref:cell envelope integrity protein TolA n=1 Tax=Serratia nevei TaxID=2703794 RepID=UPI003F7D7BCD
MPMLDTNNVSGGLALILYKYAPGIFSNTTLIRLIIIHKDRDMIITHSGYKTGIAILLAAMTALTLTGCAKHTAPSQNDPANKEVDDLFANLGDPKTPAPGKEKLHYMTQVQAEIQRHLKDAATYSGQRCTLRITLAPDGMPVGVRTEGGDPDLCRAAMQAVADARLPKPPTPEIQNALQIITLEFRPQ